MAYPKIKFFLTPFYVPDNYSPEAIALGEGLRELGIPFSSNIDYWFEPEHNDYLFKASDSDDYEVGFFEYKYFYPFGKWTRNRVKKDRYNILFDRNDWIEPDWKKRKAYELFDVVLACHLLKKFPVPANMLPWSIGFTKRISTYIDRYSPSEFYSDRRIIRNFRVPHNLRRHLVDQMDPILAQKFEIYNQLTDTKSKSQTEIKASEADNVYWKQTFRRHNPAYYQLLNDSLMTYAFGGYFEYRPHVYQPYTVLKKLRRRPYMIYEQILTRLKRDIAPARFVFQYDNFRFWEVLYSTSCAINLDYDYWGFRLPVMPEEGKHYLGIKGLDGEAFAHRLAKMEIDEIKEIGLAGKKWVHEHYSPVAVAQRLLSIIQTHRS